MASSAVEEEFMNMPYQTIIGEEFGEAVHKVLEHLSLDYESTDEKLASKTGLSVNEVRKALYKLYDSRIATYRRYRDVKTGHFVHLWKLLPVRFGINAYRKKVLLTIEKLKQRLEYEKNNVFFHCGMRECSPITFDEALELRFRCPVCSNPLQAVDNEKTIEFLTKKIKELETELEKLSENL